MKILYIMKRKWLLQTRRGKSGCLGEKTFMRLSEEKCWIALQLPLKSRQGDQRKQIRWETQSEILYLFYSTLGQWRFETTENLSSCDVIFAETTIQRLEFKTRPSCPWKKIIIFSSIHICIKFYLFIFRPMVSFKNIQIFHILNLITFII